MAESALKRAIENLRLDEVNALLTAGTRYDRAFSWIRWPTTSDHPDALRYTVALVEYLVRQNLSLPAHAKKLHQLYDLAASYPSLIVMQKILSVKRGAVRDVEDPYDFDLKSALVMAYESYRRVYPKSSFPVDLARILVLDEGAEIDARGSDGYDTVYTMAVFACDRELAAFCQKHGGTLDYEVPYDEPPASVFRLNDKSSISRVEYELSLTNYLRAAQLIEAGASLWALDAGAALFKDYWWKVLQKMVDRLIGIVSDQSQPAETLLARLKDEVRMMIQFFEMAQRKKTKGASFKELFAQFQSNIANLNGQYYKDRKANARYQSIIVLGMWLKLVFEEDGKPGEVFL